MNDKMVFRLISSIPCSSCGKYFEASDVEILESQEDICLVYAVCNACHVASYIVILASHKKTAMYAELFPQREAKPGTSGAVTEEDLLEMHRFLKDFDGDLAALLRELD